jgi:hypothetical protein
MSTTASTPRCPHASNASTVRAAERTITANSTGSGNSVTLV